MTEWHVTKSANHCDLFEHVHSQQVVKRSINNIQQYIFSLAFGPETNALVVFYPTISSITAPAWLCCQIANLQLHGLSPKLNCLKLRKSQILFSEQVSRKGV